MSQESDGVSEDIEEALEWFTKWYHIPAVLSLFVFAFWVRARTWGNYVTGGEVYYSGNDAWYHLRQVKYTVRHWPETMPFEVWTRFPQGTSVGQFGTLFDQVIATVALIVGLGDPSTRTIEMVHLFAPAVIGAAVVIPTYYLGKRVGKTKFAGVIAALIVALSTGTFLRRSFVGATDHQIAEVLMQAIAALAIVVALQVADKEKPIWELFVDRDVAGLRRPVGYAVLAGVATALYMWVWPPGLLLVGILGLYITIQAAVDHLKGQSPEPVLIVGAVLFLVTAILMILPLAQLDLQPTNFSLLHPGIAIAGAAWCGALAWVSRVWDSQSYPVWTYPIVAFGTIGVSIFAINLLAPQVYGLLESQFYRVFGQVVGQPPTATAATVGEAQPLDNVQQTFRSWLGFTHIIAIIGVGLALGRQTVSKTNRSELLFVVVWLFVIFSASITQQRFSVYIVVPVAVMAAYAIGAGIRYITSTAESASTDVRPYQVMAIFTVLIVVTAPMVMLSVQGRDQDVLTQSESRYNPGPGGVLGWDSSLDWMADNTPDVGNFAGAGNDLSYWGEYSKTDDYDYKDGTYGVISWWDYGHWITTEGERIPVANPFQQNADQAAKFLLAQSEDRADEVRDVNMSDGTNRDTRYVMVDWKMAQTYTPRPIGGKFFAPPAFVDGVDRNDYYRSVLGQTPQGDNTGQYFNLHKQAYYETMSARLYRAHGSAMEPQPIVTSWGREVELETQGGGTITRYVQPRGANTSTVEVKDSMSAAREAANDSARTQVGGLGGFPSERVPALEHYRLVQVSDTSAGPFQAGQVGIARLLQNGFTVSGLQQLTQRQFRQLIREQNPSWTKVFERVPGGTIEGQGPANTTVTASVTMRMPNANSTFDYRQQAQTGADGEFTMTVPYASTGAENWGTDDGYTNTSVRATGPYEVSTPIQRQVVNDTLRTTIQNGTVDVTEGQVIGVNDSASPVTLSESVIAEQDLNTSDGNETTDNPDSNGESDSNETLGDPAPPAPTVPDLQARIAG